MQKIQKIYIKDLYKFVNSDEYKNMPNIPISYHRALSYIKNSRANKNNIAFYLLYLKDELIGYRCMFSDWLWIEENRTRIQWISGSWIHPKHRRKGYSLQILNEIVKDLNGNILFSNYAPQSKALYDKSKYFKQIKSLVGKRFYIRLSFHQILPYKNRFFRKIIIPLKFIDKIGNLFIDIKFLFVKPKTKSIKYNYISFIDDEIKNFISQKNIQNPFKRNQNELNHFQKYPWVIQAATVDAFSKKYFFSDISHDFFYNNIKIYNNNKISAFFIIKINVKNMEIPYLYYNKNELNNIFCVLLKIIKKNKIRIITIFDENLLEIFSNKKFYLFTKKFSQNFYSSKEISSKFEDKNYIFYPGDGDNVYT